MCTTGGNAKEIGNVTDESLLTDECIIMEQSWAEEKTRVKDMLGKIPIIYI